MTEVAGDPKDIDKPASPSLQTPPPSKASEIDTKSSAVPLYAPESPETSETDDASTAPAPHRPKSALAARMERFQALKAAKAAAAKDNQSAAREEVQRNSNDPKAISKLQSILDRTEYKIIKAEEGDSFERKRAWDYTAQESTEWDRKQAKRARNRDNTAFKNYGQQSNTDYKRSVKHLGPVDKDAYAAQKTAKLQRQVEMGRMKVCELEDGDVMIYDPASGRLNEPADEEYQFDHRPSEEAIDRLVNDAEKREQSRAAARAKRGLKDEGDQDVTFINEKNKQFNQKLARFYNKYTSDIRENLERGTAI